MEDINRESWKREVSFYHLTSHYGTCLCTDKLTAGGNVYFISVTSFPVVGSAGGIKLKSRPRLSSSYSLSLPLLPPPLHSTPSLLLTLLESNHKGILKQLMVFRLRLLLNRTRLGRDKRSRVDIESPVKYKG